MKAADSDCYTSLHQRAPRVEAPCAILLGKLQLNLQMLDQIRHCSLVCKLMQQFLQFTVQKSEQ
jgi:hypothetical protein